MPFIIEYDYPEKLLCSDCGKHLPWTRKYRYRYRQGQSRFLCGKNCSSITVAARFWSKVDKSPGHGPKGECWIWTRGKHEFGYGIFGFNGKNEGAHRAAWILATGVKPPDNMHVCHVCDNPACVRLEHLFLGSPADNINDCLAKGRFPKGERSGHAKLSQAQVDTIRLLLSDGKSLSHIGAIFGIAKCTVSAIKNHRIWKQVGLGTNQC